MPDQNYPTQQSFQGPQALQQQSQWQSQLGVQQSSIRPVSPLNSPHGKKNIFIMSFVAVFLIISVVAGYLLLTQEESGVSIKAIGKQVIAPEETNLENISLDEKQVTKSEEMNLEEVPLEEGQSDLLGPNSESYEVIIDGVPSPKFVEVPSKENISVENSSSLVSAQLPFNVTPEVMNSSMLELIGLLSEEESLDNITDEDVVPDTTTKILNIVLCTENLDVGACEQRDNNTFHPGEELSLILEISTQNVIYLEEKQVAFGDLTFEVFGPSGELINEMSKSTEFKIELPQTFDLANDSFFVTEKFIIPQESSTGDYDFSIYLAGDIFGELEFKTVRFRVS